MVLDEAAYFTRRALTQIDFAAQAADDHVAQIHVRLSSLYLRRSLAETEGMLVERPSSVIPLRPRPKKNTNSSLPAFPPQGQVASGPRVDDALLPLASSLHAGTVLTGDVAATG